MERRNLVVGLTLAGLIAAAPRAWAASDALDSNKLPILMGGDFATMTSRVALRRSPTDSVRTFAQLEIGEQTAVAHAFGAVPGAAGLRPDQRDLLHQLEATRGSDFDAMYVEGQIAGHRELLVLHEHYARSGGDPMARGAAVVAVAAIETHLTMLQAIRGALG